MSKYLTYFILTLLALTICFGQSKHLEESQDSLRVISYIELIIKFNRSNYDSALLYARKAQSLSKEIDSQELLARSKYRLATVYINQNQIDLANRELIHSLKFVIRSDIRKYFRMQSWRKEG